MAREVLKKWNKNTFGIIHERKNDLEGKLAKLQKDMSSTEIAQLERRDQNGAIRVGRNGTSPLVLEIKD